MVEPVTALIGMSVIAGVHSLSSGLSNRLASRFIKTPFDEAQLQGVELKKEALEIQRETLGLQKERLRISSEEFRERMDFERQKFNREINARFDLMLTQNRLNSWPLTVNAPDIIQRAKSYNNNALSLIIAPRVKYTSKNGLPAAYTAINELRSWLTDHYNPSTSSHPVIAYPSPMDMSKSKVMGEAFTSSLYSMLKMTPTLLVEVEIPSPDKIIIFTSSWGTSEDYEAPIVSSPVEISLEGISEEEHQSKISLALKIYLAAVIDIFHLTKDISTPTLPKFRSVLSEHSHQINIDESILEYVPIFNIYSKCAPAIGTECAMQVTNNFLLDGKIGAAKSSFITTHNQIKSHFNIKSKSSEWWDISGIKNNNNTQALTPHLTKTLNKFPNTEVPEQESTRLKSSEEIKKSLSIAGNSIRDQFLYRGN